MLETVKAAAIRQNGKVYHVESPGRHGDVFRHMHEIGVIFEENEQGFLTDQDRFVNRKEAWHIAIQANQIIRTFETSTVDELFSEHVW